MQLEQLQQQVEAGEQFQYLYFWGHRPRKDGLPSDACFSQWYEAPFIVDRVHYPTAEHYMMAGKARLFSDASAEEAVLAASDPGKAKALGRTVRNYDDNAWCAHRFQIVVDGNYAKFSQNAALHDYLLKTGNKVLVEASPVDAIWGIGLSRDDDAALQPSTWQGLNLLGFALMEVRNRLKKTG